MRLQNDWPKYDLNKGLWCGAMHRSDDVSISHDAALSSSCIYFLIEVINWIEFHMFPFLGVGLKHFATAVKCKCRSMECKRKFMWVGEHVCVRAIVPATTTMIASECKVEAHRHVSEILYKRDWEKQRADMNKEIEKRRAKRENRIEFSVSCHGFHWLRAYLGAV